MKIDYPDNELTMNGKYLPEITSLFAMRYINSNEEPVNISQDDYCDWCEKNGLDMFDHVKQLVLDFAVVSDFRFFLKMPVEKLSETMPDSQKTWQVWASEKPQHARFTNLILKQTNGFAFLRPGHFATVSQEDMYYFATIDYITFTDQI